MRLLIAVCAVFLFGCAAKEELVLISTSKGDMTVYLYPEAPEHRANFLKLVQEGFYDSTTFHRVVDGAMIQGGDPYSKDSSTRDKAGQGGPGYTLAPEISDTLYHKRGVLATARMGDMFNPKRESNGSQFFIVQGKTFTDTELDQIEKQIQQTNRTPDFHFSEQQRQVYKTIGGMPFLDMQYTIFGIVVDGMEVVDSIAKTQMPNTQSPSEIIPMRMKIVKMKRKDLIKKGVIKDSDNAASQSVNK